MMHSAYESRLNDFQAFHGSKSWVNYFLHTGHLHIEGLKMSKSLKNFITIDVRLTACAFNVTLKSDPLGNTAKTLRPSASACFLDATMER